MADNAIARLGDQHSRVRQLFHRLFVVPASERPGLFERIVDMVDDHATLEEEVMYPAIREHVPNGAAAVAKSLREHQEIAQELERLEGDLAQEGYAEEQWLEEVRAVFDAIEDHVIEEENGPFDELRRELDETELVDLANALDQQRSLPS